MLQRSMGKNINMKNLDMHSMYGSTPKKCPLGTLTEVFSSKSFVETEKVCPLSPVYVLKGNLSERFFKDEQNYSCKIGYCAWCSDRLAKDINMSSWLFLCVLIYVMGGAEMWKFAII